MLREYCTVDETGIHFDKKTLLAKIEETLKEGGIDKEQLGLGYDDAKASNYLYDYMAASMASQLPYIPGSDKEAQGYIYFYRDINQDGLMEETEQLTYMGYQSFSTMLKTTDDSEKDDSLQYFSIDEAWNICITKPYKMTINGNLETYNIIEVKIPYQMMVAQYTMPFEFFITLQRVTQNANYVEAVADLENDNSKINFSIFDNIEKKTTEYTYNHSLMERKTEVVFGTKPDGTVDHDNPPTSTFKETGPHVQPEETTITITEIDTITANITKANTWILEQEIPYVLVEEEPEYPLGENGLYEKLPDEHSVNNGTYKVDQSEFTKITIEKKKWMQQGTKINKLSPGLFMGLWKNDSGVYKKGAQYNPNGKVVKYRSSAQDESYRENDRPIINILTAEEWFRTLLERNVKTQTHAVLMKELIELYRSGKPVDQYILTDIDLEMFLPKEFKETDWSRLGGGFWWPLDTEHTRITSYYGPRKSPTAGATSYHRGIDIGVPVGTEVVATADGVVEIASNGDATGLWIRIDHGNGMKSVYMHLSQRLVVVRTRSKTRRCNRIIWKFRN